MNATIGSAATTASGGRGTLRYRAPERSLEGAARGKPAKAHDVYSFGMLTWEICSGDVPFRSMRDEAIIANHVKAALGHAAPVRPPLAPVPAALREVVVSCWAQDAARRPAFEASLPKLAAAAEATRREEQWFPADWTQTSQWQCVEVAASAAEHSRIAQLARDSNKHKEACCRHR